MIKFSLPGYYINKDVLLFFAFLQQEHPEVFIENRRFDSAYDLPPDLIWNGGRVSFDHSIDPSDWDYLAKDYQDKDIALRHTCTNQLLDERHFTDPLCNDWMRICENKNNSVIVYSEEFANYIKTNYPDYNIIYSTTRTATDLNTINQLSKDNLVVLNYNKNHDEKYLQALQYPQNVEILCAELCVPNCPCRNDHYKYISAHQLRQRLPGQTAFKCPFDKENALLSFYDSLTLPHGITNEYVDELYNTYGIANFKISGRRAVPIFVIEAICYYLIKPEMRDFVRQNALLHAYYR